MAAASVPARRLLRAKLPCLVVVGTGSMRPLLPIGAIVEVRPCRAPDLRADDIACVDPGDGPLVLHRYLGSFRAGGVRWVVTRGDRCSAPDDPVKDHHVLGRAAVVHWHGLRVELERAPGRLASRLLGAIGRTASRRFR